MPKEEKEVKYIETPLYKEKVIVRFYPESHRYYVSVDGGRFTPTTGVTTYIGIKDKSRALSMWQQQITADYLFDKLDKKCKIGEDEIVEAIMQCEIKKEEAADIGTDIHAWVENYIRFKLKQKGFEEMPDMPTRPEAVTGVNSFLDWEKAHKVKFISTETPVYSLKEGYVGIEDATFIADDLFCDGDWKSSNGLYNSVRMQLAAYGNARMEEGGKKTQGRWAIRFSKYSEKEYYAREERKREIKRVIARIQGKDYKETEPKPYQVFEAKFLDADKKFFARDLEMFLLCKKLTAWDKSTDPFIMGEDW